MALAGSLMVTTPALVNAAPGDEETTNEVEPTPEPSGEPTIEPSESPSPSPSPTLDACTPAEADTNGDGQVSTQEIIECETEASPTPTPSPTSSAQECPDVDINNDGIITMEETFACVPELIDECTERELDPNFDGIITMDEVIACDEEVAPEVSFPVIGSLTPEEGPRTGGTQVLVGGQNLDQVTAVTFGDKTVTEFDVLSDGRGLVVESPGGDIGDVPVTFTTASDMVDPDLTFTYTSVRPERIVNGSPASILDFPWQVELLHWYDNNYYLTCGGSIVSETDILTAAHCLEGRNASDFVVLVGGDNLGAFEYGVDVISADIHPSWDPSTLANDIAALHLDGPLTLSPRVQPVAIPFNQNPSSWPARDSEAIVTGFGATSWGGELSEDLMKAEIDVLASPSDVDCGNYGTAYSDYYTVMLCAGGFNEYGDIIDACQGDSGGPLVSQVDGEWLLSGITSWGYECARDGYPGVYTRVGAFLDWIDANTNLDPPDAVTGVETVTGFNLMFTTWNGVSVPGKTLASYTTRVFSDAAASQQIASSRLTTSQNGGRQYALLGPSSFTNGATYYVQVEAAFTDGTKLESGLQPVVHQQSPAGRPGTPQSPNWDAYLIPEDGTTTGGIRATFSAPLDASGTPIGDASGTPIGDASGTPVDYYLAFAHPYDASETPINDSTITPIYSINSPTFASWKSLEIEPSQGLGPFTRTFFDAQTVGEDSCLAIRAVNENGISDAGNCAPATTSYPSHPGPPVWLADPRYSEGGYEVELKWQSPPWPEPIPSWIVEYKRDDQDSWRSIGLYKPDTGEHSFTVYEVYAGHNYEFRVRARLADNATVGDWSDVVDFKAASAPEWVSQPRVIDAEEGRVTLTWSEPDFTWEKRPFEWVLKTRAEGSYQPPSTEVIPSTGQTHTYEVTGLTTGEAYNFTVAAQDLDGTALSPASRQSATVLITPTSLPSGIDFGDVVAGNGVYVATSPSHGTFTSSDGASWAQTIGPVNSQRTPNLTFDGTTFGQSEVGERTYSIRPSWDGFFWRGVTTSELVRRTQISLASSQGNGVRSLQSDTGTVDLSYSLNFGAPQEEDWGTFPIHGSWTKVSNPAGNYSHVESFAKGSGTWLGATDSRKIIRSTNNGASWTLAWSKSTSGAIDTLEYANGAWLLTACGEVLQSTNNGSSWTPVLTAFKDSNGCWTPSDVEYANGVWLVSDARDGSIWRSTNAQGSDDWTQVSLGAAVGSGAALAYGNGRWLAVGRGAQPVKISDDDGLTWRAGDSIISDSYDPADTVMVTNQLISWADLPTNDADNGSLSLLAQSDGEYKYKARFGWDNSSKKSSLYWLLDVEQFGGNQIVSGEYAFRGYAGASMSAAGALDTSNLTNLEYMFWEAKQFNGDVSNWDTSKVTSLGATFASASAFNGDVSGWDTSAVVSMSSVFLSAAAFNGDLSSWDTSRVTQFQNMFFGASSFDGDLSSWDTSQATSMEIMFYGAQQFNGDISQWDTSRVTRMSMMFAQASSFNRDLSLWCVSRIATTPDSFDAGASAWTLPRPVWGTCPERPQPGVGNLTVSVGASNTIAVFYDLPAEDIPTPGLSVDAATYTVTNQAGDVIFTQSTSSQWTKPEDEGWVIGPKPEFVNGDPLDVQVEWTLSDGGTLQSATVQATPTNVSPPGAFQTPNILEVRGIDRGAQIYQTSNPLEVEGGWQEFLWGLNVFSTSDPSNLSTVGLVNSTAPGSTGNWQGKNSNIWMPGVINGITYYYSSVVATKEGISPFSARTPFTPTAVLPQVQTQQQPWTTGSGSVTLEWVPIVGAYSYQIEMTTDRGNTWEVVTGGTRDVSFTVEASSGKNGKTKCETNTVIDGSRPASYVHERADFDANTGLECFGTETATNIPGTATRHVVRGLDPDKTYNFRIAGVNDNGVGVYSWTSWDYTPGPTVDADIDVSVAVGAPGVIGVFWDVVGDIDPEGYCIEIRLEGEIRRGQCRNDVQNVAIFDTSLETGVTYTVTVEAILPDGTRGIFSDEVPFVPSSTPPAGAPRPPEVYEVRGIDRGAQTYINHDQRARTQAEYMWFATAFTSDDPADFMWAGSLNGYQTEIPEYTSGGWPWSMFTPFESDGYNWEGLTNGQDYYLSTVSITRDGVSAWTPREKFTPRQVPSQPQNGKWVYEPYTPGVATLEWQPPASAAPDITGYRVDYVSEQGDQRDWRVGAIVDSDERSASISLPEGRYLLRVAALSSNGVGEWSYSYFGAVDAGSTLAAPEWTSQPFASTSNSVRVSWLPVTGADSYVVEQSTDGGQTWGPAVGEPTSEPVTFVVESANGKSGKTKCETNTVIEGTRPDGYVHETASHDGGNQLTCTGIAPATRSSGASMSVVDVSFVVEAPNGKNGKDKCRTNTVVEGVRPESYDHSRAEFDGVDRLSCFGTADVATLAGTFLEVVGLEPGDGYTFRVAAVANENPGLWSVDSREYWLVAEGVKVRTFNISYNDGLQGASTKDASCKSKFGNSYAYVADNGDPYTNSNGDTVVDIQCGDGAPVLEPNIRERVYNITYNKGDESAGKKNTACVNKFGKNYSYCGDVGDTRLNDKGDTIRTINCRYTSPTATEPDSTPATSTARHTVSYVSPTSGTSDGGDVIEIHGDGLSNAVRVAVGDVEAPFVVINDSELDVTAPPASGAGTVDVTVIFPPGEDPVTYPDAYTYVGERSGEVVPISVPGDVSVYVQPGTQDANQPVIEWVPGQPVNLPYGYSTITAVDIYGDDLTVVGAGSCSVTGGIITVGSTSEVCELRVQDTDSDTLVTTPTGSSNTEPLTFTPRLGLGAQTATLAAKKASKKLTKGSTVTLGTKSQTVTHANYRSKGKPITWKVTKGKDVCSVSTGKKGKVTLTVSKKGSCTVQATAPKVKNRYTAYKTTYTWKIK